MRQGVCVWLLAGLILCWAAPPVAAKPLSRFDRQVKAWAEDCRAQVVIQLNRLLQDGQLSLEQLFDTFYVPIPGTDPQKFHTQYDRLTDRVLQPILDRCLDQDPRLVFVVVVDRNGYLPTHNRRFSQPATGDPGEDSKWNRTKRIFNDSTGLAAARNLQPYLLQRYRRDTGEEMSDLSLPIFIQQRHWGALRVGYRQE